MQRHRALQPGLPGAIPSASRRFLSNAADQCLQGTPASFSWLEPASRSGLSLSRNDCPFPGHHFEVKAPDLLLRHPAVHSPSPFGSRFPYAPRFAPARAGSLPKSRCLTPARHFQPFLGSPLPFGAFRALKDQSVQPDSWPGSSPSERSRLPITPRYQFYFTSADTRSPLQAR
jgi:hypothetical protein